MNEVQLSNGSHIPIAKDGRPPFTDPDKEIVNKKKERIQNLLFGATLGLTSGLIFGGLFNTSPSLVGRLTPAAFSIGWVIYPFKPYQGSYSTLLKEPERVDRIASLLFSSFIGFCASVELHRRVRLNEGSSNSNSLNTLLLVIQCTWMATNLFASYRLRQLDPEQERLQTGYSIGCSALNKFKERASFISDLSQRVYDGTFGGMATALVNWRGGDHLPIKSEQELIREQTRAETASIKAANLKSLLIFNQLISFIQGDRELKEAYESTMRANAGDLLPPYQMSSPSPVSDPDVQAFGNELRIQNYWYGQTTRVRYFLSKNPEFRELLEKKFFASTLPDEDELLKYFSFSRK